MEPSSFSKGNNNVTKIRIFAASYIKNVQIMTIARITLKRDKEKSILRRHPWVFSGAIARKDKDLHDGDIVEVFDARN